MTTLSHPVVLVPDRGLTGLMTNVGPSNPFIYLHVSYYFRLREWHLLLSMFIPFPGRLLVVSFIFNFNFSVFTFPLPILFGTLQPNLNLRNHSRVPKIIYQYLCLCPHVHMYIHSYMYTCKGSRQVTLLSPDLHYLLWHHRYSWCDHGSRTKHL